MYIRSVSPSAKCKYTNSSFLKVFYPPPPLLTLTEASRRAEFKGTIAGLGDPLKSKVMTSKMIETWVFEPNVNTAVWVCTLLQLSKDAFHQDTFIDTNIVLVHLLNRKL